MPYTRALMDSIPRLSDPSGARLHAIAGRPPDLVNPPKGCRFAPRCPYVQEKCRQSEPPLRTAGSADHLFACWFPLVNGVYTAPVPVAAPGGPDASGQNGAVGTPAQTPIDPGAGVGSS
jgi:peptide/nickel transport system ATP-binding protein